MDKGLNKLAAVCLAFLAIQAHAQLVVTRIADTATPVPGYTAAFEEFQVPSVDGGVIAFHGRRAAQPTTAGIYLGSGGPLTVIADRTMPIPQGVGNFISFG